MADDAPIHDCPSRELLAEGFEEPAELVALVRFEDGQGPLLIAVAKGLEQIAVATGGTADLAGYIG